MTALSPREISLARVLVWIAAAIFAIRWGVWAITTDQPWYVRMMVGGLAGAFLLGAIPPALRWISERSQSEFIPKPDIGVAPAAEILNPPPFIPVPQATSVINEAAPGSASQQAPTASDVPKSSGPVAPPSATAIASSPRSSGAVGLYIEGGHGNTFSNIRVSGMANPIIQKNSSNNKWSNVDINSASPNRANPDLQISDAKEMLTSLARIKPIAIFSSPGDSEAYAVANDILKFLVEKNSKLISKSVIVENIMPLPERFLTIVEIKDAYILKVGHIPK
jgi:hypothetical protein